MLKQLTVYEIRNIIRQNFKDACSDSLGSIQAAVKNLLAEEKVSFVEYVEKGVNKKRFSITDKGREDLMEWLSTPADMTGAKNMEVGKLLFMGLVPCEKRSELITEIIIKMETELAALNGLWNIITTQGAANMIDTIAYWQKTPDYLAGILKATQNSDINKSAEGIGAYQMYTLEFGIANLQFAVDWFKSLKERIEENEEK